MTDDNPESFDPMFPYEAEELISEAKAIGRDPDATIARDTERLLIRAASDESRRRAIASGRYPFRPAGCSCSSWVTPQHPDGSDDYENAELRHRPGCPYAEGVS